MKERGKFYMNPHSGSVFLCTENSTGESFEGVCIKASLFNIPGEFSDNWDSGTMVEVTQKGEFEFEEKQIPEYTMSEAIKLVGHEFKIKK